MSALGDLVVNLTANHRPFTRNVNTARGQLESFVSRAKSLVAPLAAVFAGRAMLSAAETQLTAHRKLESVLKATGGAAGLTAKEIRAYAGELQALTDHADHATVSAAGVLATFKEVRGDVFKDALARAQDLSSVLGSDLQGSVLQLGKALNDPIKGITALTRSGVSFTEEQQRMIRSLQQSGDLMGAQRIILDELAAQFGGAAQAMASPMVRLRNSLGGVAAELGEALLPAVHRFASGVVDALADPESTLRRILALVKGAAGAFGHVLDLAVQWGAVLKPVAWTLGTIVALTVAWRTAIQAAAAAKAMLLALAGPKGWAVLAAGIGVAAAAAKGLEWQFERTAGAAGEVEREAEHVAQGLAKVVAAQARMNDGAAGMTGGSDDFRQMFEEAMTPAQRFAQQIERIEDLGYRMRHAFTSDAELRAAFTQMRDHAINAATGVHDQIGSLTDEIRLLRGEVDETGLMMERMLAVDPNNLGLQAAVAEFERLRDLRDDLLAKRDAADEERRKDDRRKDDAAALIRATRTPLEKFEHQVANIHDLQQRALIDGETAQRAWIQALEDLERETERRAGQVDRSLGRTEAAELGSDAGIDMVRRALGDVAEDKSVEKKIEMNTKQQVAHARIAADRLNEIERQLRQPPKVAKF